MEAGDVRRPMSMNMEHFGTIADLKTRLERMKNAVNTNVANNED
jgi:hypothetical protein